MVIELIVKYKHINQSGEINKYNKESTKGKLKMESRLRFTARQR